MCCRPPPGKSSAMLWKPSEHFPNGFLEAKTSAGQPDASTTSLRGEGWVWAALVTPGCESPFYETCRSSQSLLDSL